MRLGAMVLGGSVVDEAALSIDLENSKHLELARSQSNWFATVDREEVDVVPAALVRQI